MDSRRRFIGKFAGGLAGALAAPDAVSGARERIRLGLIGAGARGMQLAREAVASGKGELVAAADIYAARLEQCRAAFAGARAYGDYRELVRDPSVDAVIIATPPHQHASQFVAALEAGKPVYQERVMAFTVEHAWRMRAAWERNGQVVQIGHQTCCSGQAREAREWVAAGLLGKVTAIRAHCFRNTPSGKAPWHRPVHPGMTEAAIDWKGFLCGAPARAFDPNRYVNWRYFQDYSGGQVFESMSQQLAFWVKVLDLGVPRAATMRGGVYLWKDGREAPDTMSVTLEFGEELMFSWDSGMGNSEPGTGELALGTDGTIVRGQQIRYLPQKVNRPGETQRPGRSPARPRAVMENFLDAVAGVSAPECPFEIGFRVSVACRMALESLRHGRTVYWDPDRGEIV